MRFEDIPDRNEQFAVKDLLVSGSASLSASIDKFATWLLVAFGATFAILIANVNEVSAFIPVPSIVDAAYLFIFAAILGIIQKFVGIVVAIESGATEASSVVGRNIAERGHSLDMDLVAEMIRKAMWPPSRWYFAYGRSKRNSGNIAWPGTLCARLTEVQLALVFVESVLLISSAIKIVSALGETPLA